MFKKICYSVIILICVLFMFGCKQGEIKTSFYTQDLIDVWENKDRLSLNTEVTFPVPTEKWFNKNEGKINRIVKDHFTVNRKARIVESGLNTMASVEIEIPFMYVNPNKKSPENTKPFNYFVMPMDKDDKAHFGLFFGRELLDLKNSINNTFPMSDFDIGNFDFVVELRNTMREKFVFDTMGTYVDDEAVVFKTENEKFTINERDEVEIEVSNLLMNYFRQKGGTTFIKY